MRAAARHSLVAPIYEGFLDEDAQNYFPLPRYFDGQFKSEFDLEKGASLQIGFLSAGDQQERTLPNEDPLLEESEERKRGFYRAYVRYLAKASANASYDITPFVGFDRDSLDQEFGELPARTRERSYRYGIRSSYRYKITPKIDFHLGTDILGTHAKVERFGSLTRPPREGDIRVFGNPPGDEVASDDFSTDILDLGVFVETQAKIGAFRLVPGMRFGAFLLSANRALPPTGDLPTRGSTSLEGVADPRLLVEWQTTPRLLLYARGGRYHQPPRILDLSSVFGNPTLGLEGAWHGVLGARTNITKELSAELATFAKHLDNLHVRNPLSNPAQGESVLQGGRGRVYGAQALLKQAPWKGWSGYLSYTISRSERRLSETRPFRLFDGDQTHNLSALLNYAIRMRRVGSSWNFGSRFRYLTGTPRTPVIDSFYDASGDRFQPIFGDQNSIRLDEFIQLDLRAQYDMALQSALLHFYLEVQNVTFRRNVEELAYDFSFSEQRNITGLPTLVVLGAKVEF